MFKKLTARLKNTEKLRDSAHIRAAVLGIFRISIQHACIVLGEWIVLKIKQDLSNSGKITEISIDKFYAPSDGELVSLLSELLVAAENIGWRYVGRKYWEQIELPSSVRLITKTSKSNIETALNAFVKLRNDGVEGHGLPGGYKPEAEIELIKILIEKLEHILPVINTDESTLSFPEVGNLQSINLSTVRVFNGDPICYRRLKRLSAGKIQVDAQIQRTLLSSDPISFEVPNFLLDIPKQRNPEYSIPEISWSDTWSPFVYMPDRMASPEVFTGRASELQELSTWVDDSDSRKCMVFGDGGIGKTTLAVEFLHQILDGKIKPNWKPTIITFYTAKKTRWGINGLEHISAQDVGVADVVLDIARLLSSEPLDRSWFDRKPTEIIQKLAALQTNLKITRDDHLIILDNTETMANNEVDIKSLANQINELAKRIGRIILTSRRRESIEAHPIQTDNWKPEESLEFLRKRGRILNCTSIKTAGDQTLRKYAKQLNNKPIALEVFVQAVTEPSTSLDNAYQRVQRMQRQDLGHFLYQDAWSRIQPELRYVILLLSKIGDVHDEYMLQLCCQRANVTVSSASEALEESKGIASIIKFDGHTQIQLMPEFYNYCRDRFEIINDRHVPTDEDVDWVKRRYAEFIRNSNSIVRDRHMRAFRVPAARAAWRCFMEKRYDEAIQFYETAVNNDPENSWLYDRYAYSLFKLKDYEKAATKAKKATEISPQEAEFWFTYGMIESRIGNLDLAISYLGNAQKFGKAQHLCDLQKAYAYIYKNSPQKDMAKKFLAAAVKNAPNDGFLSIFMTETKKFERRWLA